MSNKTGDWMEVKKFRDTHGREVTQFEVLGGKERGKKFYQGCVMLVAQSPDPRLPDRRMPFEFDFPEGKSFEWVTRNFDKEAQAAKEEFEKEQKAADAEARKAKIHVPGKGGIVGPSGKIIKT